MPFQPGEGFRSTRQAGTTGHSSRFSPVDPGPMRRAPVPTLTYPGACSLHELRRMLSGEEAKDETKIQQFVLNGCILHMLIERTPGFGNILGGLRYDVETRRARDLGEVPIPVVCSVIRSVRPAAEVMIDAAADAGVDQFEEVIDPKALDTLEDPLRTRLQKHMGG